MANKPEILVVGAGIIGASLAWRLRDAGAAVRLVESATPGGVASRCSFGWINATYGNPKAYFDLRVASMAEWEALGERFGDLPYRRSGTLYAHFERVDLAEFQSEHSAWGYALDWVSEEEIAELEPNLTEVPERGLYAPHEGTLHVEQAAQFFAEQFRRDGGQLLQAKVDQVVVKGGRVTGVRTGQGTLAADHVVLAAGAATQSLAASAGVAIPMTTPAGLLVSSKPCAPLIHHTVLTHGLHVQQRTDGSLLAGADFGGGNPDDDPEGGARELIGRIRAAFRGGQTVELDRFMVGYRPTPEDGMPVVGAAPDTDGLYIAAMHSGATLAAIVSRLFADEILTGAESPMLSGFRPKRFALSETVEAKRS